MILDATRLAVRELVEWVLQITICFATVSVITESFAVLVTLHRCQIDIGMRISCTDVICQQSVNLDDYESAAVLEKLGLDVLKAALMERGLKCGGTLEQRAQRLFSVKGLTVDQIDKSLFAKQPPKKK